MPRGWLASWSDLPIDRGIAAGVAALTLVALAAGGLLVVQGRQHSVASTGGADCTAQPRERAALFSDDAVTQIRISAPDLSDLRVLREDPAQDLPGMFNPLLALSDDGTRLAYVTARNPLMDDSHIWWIDVSQPALRTEVVRVASGLWPMRPSWSADKRKLAFVTVDESVSPARFRLWSTDAGGTVNPTFVGDVDADYFTHGRQTAICWNAGGRPAVVDLAPGTAGAGGTGSATSCAVPVYSQNDPTWRQLLMQPGGDKIGHFGCALTSTAMLLNYYKDAGVTPTKLNSCLQAYADPINWRQAAACAGTSLTGGSQDAFSWQKLDGILATGQPAIVGMVGGQTGIHYVVVTEGGGGTSRDYSIVDPWDGSITKTLASYYEVGYNPRWIVSFTGPGRSCTRVKPSSSGFSLDGGSDGGVSRQPLALKLSGRVSEAAVSVVDVTPGRTQTAAKKSGAQSDRHSLPYSLAIPNDGIYELVAQPWPPSPGNRVDRYKLTVNRAPPQVDVGFAFTAPAFASRATSARVLPNAAGPTSGLVAADKPVVRPPVKLRISSRDTLSGVAEISYQLDGGPWVANSDDVSFKRLVPVDGLGDHAVTAKATNLAGIESAPVRFEFTLAEDAPPPIVDPAAVDTPPTPRSSTPTRPPTNRPPPVTPPVTTTRPPSPSISPPRSPSPSGSPTRSPTASPTRTPTPPTPTPTATPPTPPPTATPTPPRTPTPTPTPTPTRTPTPPPRTP